MLLLIAKWWSTLLTRPFLSFSVSNSLSLSLLHSHTFREKEKRERRKKESLKVMQVLFLEKVVRTVYLFKILSFQISHKSILQTFLPFPNDSFILFILLPLLSFTTYDFNIWKVHLNVTRSERIRKMCESTFKKIQRERKSEWGRKWENEKIFFHKNLICKKCIFSLLVHPGKVALEQNLSLSLSLCKCVGFLCVICRYKDLNWGSFQWFNQVNERRIFWKLKSLELRHTLYGGFTLWIRRERERMRE